MDDIKAKMLKETKRIGDAAVAEKTAAIALMRMRHGPAAGAVLESMVATIGFLKITDLMLDEVPGRISRDLRDHFVRVLSVQLEYVKQAGNVSDTAMAEIEAVAKDLSGKIGRHEKDLAALLKKTLGPLGDILRGMPGMDGD